MFVESWRRGRSACRDRRSVCVREGSTPQIGHPSTRGWGIRMDPSPQCVRCNRCESAPSASKTLRVQIWEMGAQPPTGFEALAKSIGPDNCEGATLYRFTVSFACVTCHAGPQVSRFLRRPRKKDTSSWVANDVARQHIFHTRGSRAQLPRHHFLRLLPCNPRSASVLTEPLRTPNPQFEIVP